MCTIAESHSGYGCGFQIYTGRRVAPLTNDLHYDDVMHLSERFQWERRRLYLANYFSSVQLMQDLEANQMYACATVRINRAGLPREIKQPGRLGRGESIKRQCYSLA